MMIIIIFFSAHLDVNVWFLVLIRFRYQICNAMYVNIKFVRQCMNSVNKGLHQKIVWSLPWELDLIIKL